MKKIFSLLFVAAMVLTAQAQNFSFSRKGEKIADGATLNFGYVQLMPGFPMYEWPTHVGFLADKPGKFKFELKSQGDNFTMCPGGNCFTPGADIAVTITGTSEYDLELHPTAGPLFDGGANATLTGSVIAYREDNPSVKVTLNVVYHNKPAADVPLMSGVNDVVADGTSVVFDGKDALIYDAPVPIALSIYSCNGTKVVGVEVSGTGRVSLTDLAQGAYIYRMGRHTGKILLK